MKRLGVIACLTLVLVMFTSVFSFGAEQLKVTTYPVDGQENTTKDNMVVKLYFNNPVGNEESVKANEGTFKIVDKKGNELPTIIKYNPKDETQAMVLVNTNSKKYNPDEIKDDTEYTMTLSGKFIDDKGAALGKDLTINFKTMNQGRSTQIYMIMMVIMFAGMFIFSSKAMKKQMAKEKDDTEKEESFNPYKEAKKTGRPVEEIVAEHEKEQAKKAAKAAKKAAKKANDEGEEYEEDNGNHSVKAPRPIASVGGKYVTGRKALAEAKAAEIEKRKKAAANKKKK